MRTSRPLKTIPAMLLGSSLWTLAGLIVLPIASNAAQLPPDTRLRLTVVQWMPIEGAFRKWDAVSGDFLVSPQNTIAIPVIGSIPVGDMSPDELAADIVARLQTKMGLLAPPDASVAIIEQPPIYVVGSVTNPGQYSFRQGLTVLQALALGGGTLRSPDASSVSGERIQILSDLQDSDNEDLRLSARIARLKAELDQSPSIGFPTSLSGNGALAADIMAQETTVFTTRASGLTRQTESLAELGDLYDSEINVLQTKISNLDASIVTAENDLERVSSLIDKGMAVASRRTDLQQLLGNQRADRLDQLTAIMRARQYLNEAKRNMTTLQDQRRTEITEELLKGQGDLERLRLRQTTSKRLLEELDRRLLLTGGSDSAAPTIAYTVVRLEQGESQQFSALDTTQLLPGDVVKVDVLAASQSAVAIEVPQDVDGKPAPTNLAQNAPAP